MNYPYAQYTETFLEFNDRNPTFLEETITADNFGKQEYADGLIEALKSLYNFYEISGETEDTFKTYVEDVFRLRHKYYLEILENYTKKWDYEKGIQKTYDSETTSERHGEESAKSTFYDLPHKELATDEEFKKYPDNINEDGSTSRDSSRSNTNYTTTSNSLYIELKKAYLAQLRDVYLEFAKEFSDCFIHIY